MGRSKSTAKVYVWVCVNKLSSKPTTLLFWQSFIDPLFSFSSQHSESPEDAVERLTTQVNSLLRQLQRHEEIVTGLLTRLTLAEQQQSSTDSRLQQANSRIRQQGWFIIALCFLAVFVCFCN